MLIITPGFAANEQDFNCIPVLQLLVKELLNQGAEVNVIALEYPFSNQPYQWHGAKIFPCNGQNRRWLRPRTIWRAMTICHRILDKSPGAHPVLLSFWLGWASEIGERIARRRGDVQHFTTMMGQDVLPENRRHFHDLSPERCERLIAVSDFQNNQFAQSTAHHAGQVFPWGVSHAEIPLTFPASRTIDVLGVGSLIPVKNWDKWLNVIKLTALRLPNLKAELVGDGPERRRLEHLAIALGIGNQLRFVGELPRPDVLERMRQARVLLHTAHFESYGFVLSEAAMCGARVLSTPVGIAPQIGAKCATDVAQLAELLQKTVQEPLLSSGFAPFSIQETAARYRSLANHRRSIALH